MHYVKVYLVAGGVSGFSSRFDSAEVLVKGDTTWREITAPLPVGTVSSFSGVNINNKVFFIGKNIKKSPGFRICALVLSFRWINFYR